MRRSPRVLLAWSATVVVALTTARIVGGDLAALHERAASLGRQRTVVVADRDLQTGETITRDDVHTEARYAHEIPRDAITDAHAAIGRVVVIPVVRDAIVVSRQVTRADRSELDAVIPAGDRGVHVFPKDGSRPPLGAIVDVLAAFDPSVVRVEGSDNSAVVVASGARVVAVDGRNSSAGADGSETGVTLLVTEEEARVVAFAASTADLTLALAPPEAACCDGSGS